MDPMAHTCRHACLLSPHTHTHTAPTHHPQLEREGVKKKEKKEEGAARKKRVTAEWMRGGSDHGGNGE